jgi:acetolactate synthase I/II/III large subunit
LLKWAERIDHPAQAPHRVARAFQAMMGGRRGPVALKMRWDQLSATPEVTP